MGRKHGRHGAVKKKTEKQQQQPRHFVVPAKHVYATRADRAFGFIVVLLGEFQPILPHAGGGYKPKRSEKKQEKQNSYSNRGAVRQTRFFQCHGMSFTFPVVLKSGFLPVPRSPERAVTLRVSSVGRSSCKMPMSLERLTKSNSRRSTVFWRQRVCDKCQVSDN